MYENLLPLGSVVLLKDAESLVMIISRLVATNESDSIFDYSACLYPEGIVDMNSLVFFNRGDIERVYFIGFQDPEELELQERFSQLGELYVNENGEIVERKPEEATEPDAESEPPAVDPDVVETAVFADVDE